MIIVINFQKNPSGDTEKKYLYLEMLLKEYMLNRTIFQIILITAICFQFISVDNLHAQVLNKERTAQVAEKVYLHLDREVYNSGDDVWFKAYLIDPSTNRLSVNTNNLHVELIAPDSRIILSHTLKIEEGLGNGDFHLTDSVPSGQYRIRAYTNHMRNYSEQFFFLKEITIVSPYDEAQGLNKTTKTIDNNIDITFFPEGGSLVDNVTSKIAFKAVNALGKGCDVAIKLYSPAGELISTFKSIHKGMGYFNIQPNPDHTYYTVIQSSDSTETRAALPESFPAGVVISTLLNKNKNLILTVSTNESTLPMLKGLDLSVNLSSRNLINKLTKIRITSLVNNFLIPLDSIPDGIIRVTLSGVSGLPLCERLIFLQKNSDVKLNISSDKKVYKPREKVTAEISLSGDSTFTGAGDFSFSAANERFTDNSSPWPASIASWFLLESDVRGQVEEPSYYFDPSNKRRLQDLDLLLLTQGWRDFQWKYGTLTTFNHEIGFTITGSVKKIINNKPIEGAKINLGLFSGNNHMFHNTISDTSGSFKFEQLDIIGRTDAFISSTGESERILGKIFLDSIRYFPPETNELFAVPEDIELIVNNYYYYQQEASFKIANKKKYKLSDTLNLGEVFITAKKTETPQERRIKESRRTYSTPDKELVVSVASENFGGDAISYISGRVAGVRVINDTEIYIRGSIYEPLIFLDGIELDSWGRRFLKLLPMNIIDRIDVLYASPLYGMRGAGGVINIITKVGVRRDPFEQTANTASIKVHGFDAPRIYYAPKYNSADIQPFIPDTRTTIFWEPNITVEKNKSVKLVYYNADNQSAIKIIVEGVTEEGIPITSKTNYTVK